MKTIGVASHGDLLKKRLIWRRVPGFFLEGDCRIIRDVILGMKFTKDHVIVEIGSLAGRSTICMAEISPYKIVSIDPHDGMIQEVVNGEAQLVKSSKKFYKLFLTNLQKTNTANKVEVIKDYPERVKWDGRKIALLHLDGIHLEEYLEKDFRFADYVVPKGFVAFHDYGSKTYPDVKKFVDKYVVGNGYRPYCNSSLLKVVQKIG